MDRNPLQGSVVPFARRWHVIHEIDLVRLIQQHRRRLALRPAEAIADGLPERPDAPMTAAFLTALQGLVAKGSGSMPIIWRRCC
jgi:hypothetical protein